MILSRSMSVLLCLVRHGETEANVAGLLQGQGIDTPLTAQGELQAQLAGEALVGVKFSRLFCSDLNRTRKTAALIATASKGSILVEQFQYDEKLREKAFGVREGFGKDVPVEEAKRLVAEKEGIQIEQVVDKAETDSVLRDRQREFIRTLLSDSSLEAGAKVLIVTHGRFIKEFAANTAGVPSDDIVRISNCSLTGIQCTLGPIQAGEDAFLRACLVEGAVNNQSHVINTAANATEGDDELKWLRI